MPIASLLHDLDRARQTGPLQRIVIPPCPELLTRLQAEMARPDPDWQAVIDIAQADVAMAATLMRQAGGPVMGRGQPVASVEEAVRVLGLNTSAAVLQGFLARKALRTDSPHLLHFWDQSHQRATAMHFIARQLYDLPPDLAHSFGLFCEVGIPVMLQSLPGYASTLVEAKARKDRSFTATENACHQTDHAVVGALVSRAWGLAPEITLAVRLRHDLDVLADAAVPHRVRSLVAAGLVAEQLLCLHQDRPSPWAWAQHGQAALDWLQVHADEMAAWTHTVADHLDQLLASQA